MALQNYNNVRRESDAASTPLSNAALTLLL